MSTPVGSTGLALPKGVTPAGTGKAGQPQEVVWSILGHTYWLKAECDGCFIFETLDPPGTFVPPHIHPTQDEFIYMLEGTFDLYLHGSWTQAKTGDLVRMPKGLPHAYYNKQEKPAPCGAATKQQVADWLEKLGLGQYAQPFAENDISFVVLD